MSTYLYGAFDCMFLSCHVRSNPVAVTSPSDFAPASSKEFLDIQATIECGFTLKRVRDMIKTYSQNNLFYEAFALGFIQIKVVQVNKQRENQPK